MKIVKFTAENVKRLKVVQITPNGNMVEITGKNGQGKTSVLDAIWYALAGKEAIPEKPIRAGEAKARIELDLGDLVVERRFTEKDSNITVKSKDGASYGSPQKMLDSLVGSLSFDPLSFARSQAKEQYELLRKIASLDIDLEQLAREDKSDYDERTNINRIAKESRAAADKITVPDDLPNESLDEKALLDQLQAGFRTNENRQIEITARDREEKRNEAAIADNLKRRDKVAELRKQADELEADVASEETRLVGVAKQFTVTQTIPDAVDTDALRSSVDKARDINAQIAKRKERTKHVDATAIAEKKSEELTQRMENRAKARTEALKRAKMPVNGLGFAENARGGYVTFNDVPFDQASDAERLVVSMAIAMAANPKLKVIRIRDGSLLDKDSMQLIADLAKEKDYQFWIETVQSDSEMAIVMEDGVVKAAPVEGQAALFEGVKDGQN